MSEPSSHVVCEHLFRRQAGRIVSSLAALLGSRHLELAEDAVQEAMLRAVQLWPFQGVPAHPEAWLFRVAQNYAITGLRRKSAFEKKTDELIAQIEFQLARQDDDAYGSRHDPLGDDELRMIFMCCHPALPREASVALSLKLVGGFSVGEIARLFLADEAAIAQRLVRAKRLIRERNLPLPPLGEADLRGRLDFVLEVIYLMFSGGYAAPSGNELIRQDACREAIRLGRLVAASVLSEPRAHALLALMALQMARCPARTTAEGDLVLMQDQDRGLWDQDLIGLGFWHFEQSIAGSEVSTWHVQAAIAATYARAANGGGIDWPCLLKLYDQLESMTDSPVVQLNRAVVISKVLGPAVALETLLPLAQEPSLRNYHLLPAVRGRLLADLGSFDAAAAEFAAALQCGCSQPEKRFLQQQFDLVQGRA